MKKILLLLCICLSTSFIKANPIAPPPLISEFYLINNSTWQIELVFSSFYFNDTVLDNYKISTSYGSFFIKSGITVALEGIVVLSNDSLVGQLNINRSGDFIKIEKDGMMLDQIIFGNYPAAVINSPLPGQSFVNMWYQCFDPWVMQTMNMYRLVKENTPSIGTNPFQVSNNMGHFSGMVVDLNNNPISGMWIGRYDYFGAPSNTCYVDFSCISTNSAGEFDVLLSSGRYYINVFLTSTTNYLDTVINIEPDSVNYYLFVIDTLLNNSTIYNISQEISMSCFPNPTHDKVNISFTYPRGFMNKNSLIKIYDEVGNMVKILPVKFTENQNQYSVEWDGRGGNNEQCSGVFICSVEISGRKVVSQRIIITK